jgi:hypothetical protein
MVCVPTNLGAAHKPETHRVVSVVHKISLHGRSLNLHLGHPLAASALAPLVVYASGDGGWFGAAIDMYEGIVKAGYPTAGFSARSYLGLLSHTADPLSTKQLASDYEEIIRQSSTALGVDPSLPVVLTGWSRGAAFSLLAASEPEVQPHVEGVIAIGLPSKEELNIRRRGKDILVANHQSYPRQIIFETFDLISELGPMKVSLIQSTRDDFLPAEAARALFGPDSSVHRFYAVEARNHRFSGGTEAFRHSLVESLSWISQPAK